MANTESQMKLYAVFLKETGVMGPCFYEEENCWNQLAENWLTGCR